MNILYCGDRGIEDGVFISALSLARLVTEPLRIYIITMDFENENRHFLPVSETFRQKLEDFLKTEHHDVKITLYDATPLIRAYPPTANQNSRFTPGCMLRLYADEIPSLPHKLLYLDNDVVALQNPASFYNLDLKNHELAGVLDNYGSHFFQRRPHKEYLNSGVLLLNLELIKKTGLFRRARVKCQNEKMFMPDQTALNRLCTTKLILDRRYNEQAKTQDDTIFRHFTTTFKAFPYPHPQTIKPWHISKIHAKLKEYHFDNLLDVYQAKIKDIKDV